MRRFELYNGISYGMLGDTLVYILAVRFAAPNIALGFIPSAIYLTSLIIPLVMPFLANRNLKSTMFTFWMLRGLIGIGYAALLIPGLDKGFKISILLSVYALYAFFRSVAMVSYDPIAKSITTLHNRGGFYATLNFAYNFTLLFAKLIASLTTNFDDSIQAIVILQMLGVVGNIISSNYLKKIPCRLVFTYSKDTSYKQMFSFMAKSAKIRNRVFLKFLYISLSIVMGMTIPFMSSKLELSDALVIIYTVIISISYLIGGAISRGISDSVGARPLMQISGSLSIISVLFFVLCPPVTFWPFFIVGFVMNTAIQVCMIQAGGLVLGSMPDKGGPTYNILVNIGLGISGLVSGLLSGLFVDIGEAMELGRAVKLPYVGYILNGYSLSFLFGLLISLVGIILVFRLKEEGAKKASEVISLKNLQAVSYLKALEKSTDSFYRRRQVMFLGENSSYFAYQEIKRKLSSPYSRDLADILRVIGEKKRAEYLDSVIKIAQNDTNYMQIEALRTLSAFPESQQARECLIKVFKNSRWVSCRATAASSLSHFADVDEFYPEVMELSKNAEHIEICIECFEAEYRMDKNKNLFARLFIEYSLSRSPEFRQTRYSCLDALLIQNQSISKLARIYERYNSTGDVRYALSPYLDDNMNLTQIEMSYDKIISSIENEDREEIYKISDTLVDDISTSRKDILNCIKSIKAIRSQNQDSIQKTDLIACIYFAIAVCAIVEAQ